MLGIPAQAETPDQTQSQSDATPIEPNGKIIIRIGEPLRKALDLYANRGLNIVSSSLVVPKRLKVKDLPNPQTSPKEQIQSLLDAHGLTLVMVDEQNGYVAPQAGPKTPAPTTAADREQDNDRSIEEVVVTSHYRVRRQAALGHSVDQEDLLATPSLGRDVLRSLEALPGIASSGVAARHQFRGGDVNEVLYRLDGVELLEPFHLPDVYDLFSAINMNIVDAVDVYVSGFPVNLGSRMSGVVDLELIQPTKPLSGNVDVNFVNATADATGWQGPWSWVASVRSSIIDQALEQLDTDYGRPRFQDAFVQVAHESAQRRISLNLLHSRDRTDVIDPPEAGTSNNDYQSAWLHWDEALTDNLDTRWTAQHLRIKNSRQGHIDDPFFTVGSLQVHQDYAKTELTNDWHWRPSPTWDIESGWSFADQTADFHTDFDLTYGPGAQPIQGRSALQRRTDVDRSGESIEAYFSVTHQLTDSLELQSGLRFDGQDIDPVHVNEVSARFNLAWQANRHWLLAVNLGRYIQQQHLYEIQIDDGKAELDDPQHSDQINLSAIFAPHPDLRLRLDLYHRKINNAWSHFENLYNRWVLFPELQGDRFEVVPSKVSAKGLEWAINHAPSPTLRWYLNYSYSEAKERYLGTLRNRPWAQRHSVKAGVRWQGSAWRLGLNTAFHSGWPTSDWIADPGDLGTSAFGSSLPNFQTVDVHVSRRIDISRGELEVYLDVINLTNRRNIGGYRYSAADQRRASKLLPVTPILGMLWRW